MLMWVQVPSEARDFSSRVHCADSLTVSVQPLRVFVRAGMFRLRVHAYCVYIYICEIERERQTGGVRWSQPFCSHKTLDECWKTVSHPSSQLSCNVTALLGITSFYNVSSVLSDSCVKLGSWYTIWRIVSYSFKEEIQIWWNGSCWGKNKSQRRTTVWRCILPK